MAIFDFLKEIPLSAVLREKLKDVERNKRNFAPRTRASRPS